MKPHVFVAMPFGVKPGHDGSPIDFNRIYDDYLVPALAAAGLDVFRADEELRAGDIRTDMFQETTPTSGTSSACAMPCARAA